MAERPPNTPGVGTTPLPCLLSSPCRGKLSLPGVGNQTLYLGVAAGTVLLLGLVSGWVFIAMSYEEHDPKKIDK